MSTVTNEVTIETKSNLSQGKQVQAFMNSGQEFQNVSDQYVGGGSGSAVDALDSTVGVDSFDNVSSEPGNRKFNPTNTEITLNVGSSSTPSPSSSATKSPDNNSGDASPAGSDSEYTEHTTKNSNLILKAQKKDAIKLIGNGKGCGTLHMQNGSVQLGKAKKILL